MSIFDLCNTREKRFLYDLLQDAANDGHDHPLPELYALLRAVERMLGGHYEKPPFASLRLTYYIAAYARIAHAMPDDPEERLDGYTHTTHRILQGFMESVAVAIKDGAACIDLFRIPPWFYEEVMREVQLTDAARHV